jgi:hypothetical protein
MRQTLTALSATAYAKTKCSMVFRKLNDYHLCTALFAVGTCFSQPPAASRTAALLQPSDYRDQSGDLPGTETDTGLLIAGCAIAGGSIIGSLLIPSPTPELFLKENDIDSHRDRLIGFKKPAKDRPESLPGIRPGSVNRLCNS